MNIINLYIKCLKNNTITTITLLNKTIKTISTGHLGFRGGKRNTRHAAQETFKNVKAFLLFKKFHKINLYIEGFGKGRAVIIKTLKHPSFNFIKIIELSKLKHNGCRLKKKRRI